MLSRIVPREIHCRSALNTTGIPGYDYCMNPYVGCAHGCVYCYASFMCRFTEHEEDWGEFLDVKVNFPEVLLKQLSHRRRQPEGKVLLGTVTDAYQAAESRYGITRSSLKILVGYPLLEIHILTKSALVLRDIPVLRQLKSCEVGITLTTLDPEISGVFEPWASPPPLRMAAAMDLMKAKIPVWVFIAPLLPGLTDTERSLGSLFRSLHESGINEIRTDCLNPYPAVIHRLKDRYRRYFPGALPELEKYLSHPESYREKIGVRLRKVRHGYVRGGMAGPPAK